MGGFSAQLHALCELRHVLEMRKERLVYYRAQCSVWSVEYTMGSVQQSDDVLLTKTPNTEAMKRFA